MRGLIYKSLKKSDLALADYQKVIELDPNNAFAYNNRGAFYSERREWNLALADFNQAIELKPDNASFYFTRGLLYYQTQKWDLALADFERAIVLDPKLKLSRSLIISGEKLTKDRNSIPKLSKTIKKFSNWTKKL